MKSFFLSFLIVGIASYALWQGIRQKTAAMSPAGGAPVHATGQASPGESSLPHETRGWAFRSYLQRTRREQSPWTPLTAEQWRVLDAMTKEEVRHWIEREKHVPDDRLWQAVLTRWASFDGAAATKYVTALCEAHPDTGDCGCGGGERGGQFDDVAADVLACWMRGDPGAALPGLGEAAVLQPGMPARPFPRQTLAQTDFTTALDRLASKKMMKVNAFSGFIHVTLGNNGKDLSADYLGTQLDDPARRSAFIQWLQNCEDPDLACGIFARVFSRARHEGAWLRPERMPDYMPGLDQIPATLEDPDTARVMGALAMGASPLAALRTRNLLEECVAGWTYRDPESAAIWLQAQASDPELDPALVGFAKGVWRADAAAAVQWAAQITRPATRLRECARYFPRWHLRDPGEAEAWLAASDFSKPSKLYIAGQDSAQ